MVYYDDESDHGGTPRAAALLWSAVSERFLPVCITNY